MDKKIVIIGGGPAGVEAAKSAARHGARVTLVSNEEIGGRAIWHSLLPSKKWLKAARQGDKAFSRLLQRIDTAKKQWTTYNKKWLEEHRVEIVYGHARYMHARRIDVYAADNTKLDELCPDASIIASGSRPVFPEGLQPDGKRVIAPRFLSRLKHLPDSMIVIGGGVTGTESAYLFSAFGVKVTWLWDAYGLLPGFDADIRKFLAEGLKHPALDIKHPATAIHIERHPDNVRVQTREGAAYTADMAFVAVGRNGDVAQLGLNVLADEPTETVHLEVDGYGRTQFEGIYAAGDVVNRRKIANQAMAQAYIAGAHAAGAEPEPFDPQAIISAVYSEPPLAQVGMLSGPDIRTHITTYKAGLLPHIYQENGRIKLAVRSDGTLSGMAACGPQAPDIITPAAMMIRTKWPLKKMESFFAASPTHSELFFEALRNSGF
ncbi:MAG: NAD(P)/FAD-dependent oxidoreductase [Calditrichaeota bacterium]|nr:MAG: NAD(P)/FAD-dependent oxidoreductase [Calditrichota bacterium]